MHEEGDTGLATPHIDFANELLPELVAFRRHLHQIPELGFKEYKTTAFLEDLMTRWGVPYRRPLETGLIAELKGNRPGPTVALRADIDALPITEETGLPFASQHPGAMHACGHDGHTAILLGVVRRFLDLNGDFPGTVRFLFQPAEEGPGGAQPLIEQGALESVTSVYGLHLWSTIPVGQAGICAGPMMANTDGFQLRIFGKGGHGAVPQETVDSVVVAAQTILALQSVVSRRIDPLRPAVVTVGTVNAGSAANVIADTADLSGTVRSFHDDVRDDLEASIRQICETTAKAAGARAELNYERGYPALVNHERETARLRQAAADVLGDMQVHTMDPTMGGEDFAYYLEHAPGAFLFLGAGSTEVNAVYPHHHPKFNVHETPLAYGVAILSAAALRDLGA